MTTQHTPGPWGTGCGASASFIYKWLGVGEGESEIVARCATPANADFIVRACNAHDALVAALTDVVDQLDGIGIPEWCGAEGLSLEQARAEISKAKGKVQA